MFIKSVNPLNYSAENINYIPTEIPIYYKFDIKL